MISPEQFIASWNKDVFPLVKYDEKVVHSFKLSKNANEFLVKAGLPESAAPFLNFLPSNSGGAVRFNERNSVDDRFSKYIYLGYTGSGDPICVDEETGEIVQLDHEHMYEETLINSSIPQFAESLLEYSHFIKKIKQVNGRKAFLERKAPIDLVEQIHERLKEIDNKALNEKCFWSVELDFFQK